MLLLVTIGANFKFRGGSKIVDSVRGRGEGSTDRRVSMRGGGRLVGRGSDADSLHYFNRKTCFDLNNSQNVKHLVIQILKKPVFSVVLRRDYTMNSAFLTFRIVIVNAFAEYKILVNRCFFLKF